MTSRIQNLEPDILREYSAGNVPEKIAKEMHVNVKTVYAILKRRGVEMRKQRQNIVGVVFGKLTVVRFVEKDTNGKLLWECRCDCGNTTIVRGNDLRQKKIQSCGCIRRETCKQNIKHAHLKFPNTYGFTGIGDIPGQHIGQIRTGAYRRKIEYNISKEYLWKLFQDQNGKCALTGIDIWFKSRKSGKERKPTASLDRIDSNRGYVEGNVQWVHKDINNMKQHFGLEEFLTYCKMVTKHNS